MRPRSRPELHRLAARGDVAGAEALFARGGVGGVGGIDALDHEGLSPLMHAVGSSLADVTMVRLLLAHGARVETWSAGLGQPVIAMALGQGDPERVGALIEAGADIHYRYPDREREGYGALLDAVHGRDVGRDPRLIELLELLVSHGARLNDVSRWQESGLRVLSRLARFDAVRILLDAGADESQLAWTPLIRATAMGSLSNMEGVARDGAALEETEWWSRTPWLIAVQIGDLPKARRLRELGALTSAKGHCDMSVLALGVASRRPEMVRWLLEIGQDVDQEDGLGRTPLETAVESDDLGSVAALLDAGADLDRLNEGHSALHQAKSREVARALLDAGADPLHLSQEGHRALLGYPPDSDADVLADVTQEDFLRARTTRFGAHNPERMREPFWEAMIRAGVSAYEATLCFDPADSMDSGTPIWSAQRFGQSLTFLSDGRVVRIGGEHEDWYNSNFCIYNDVFVHDPDGTIHIFGYPKAVFPPTDSHTATLLNGGIYVIGGQGYRAERAYGQTPVLRLDASSFRIERMETRGEMPRWIHHHRATAISEHEIRVTGGTIVSKSGDDEVSDDNLGVYVLDLRTLAWRLA